MKFPWESSTWLPTTGDEVVMSLTLFRLLNSVLLVMVLLWEKILAGYPTLHGVSDSADVRVSKPSAAPLQMSHSPITMYKHIGYEIRPASRPMNPFKAKPGANDTTATRREPTRNLRPPPLAINPSLRTAMTTLGYDTQPIPRPFVPEKSVEHFSPPVASTPIGNWKTLSIVSD